MDSFVEHVLGPVRSYELAHGTALVATVRAFLECHGSPAEAALNLNVHVNTLRQRLERVELLTGRRFAETGDRVDLWLALQVPSQQPRDLSAPGRDA